MKKTICSKLSAGHCPWTVLFSVLALLSKGLGSVMEQEDEITTRRSLSMIKHCINESENSFTKLVPLTYPGATEDAASAMAVEAFLKGWLVTRAALLVANQSPPPTNI